MTIPYVPRVFLDFGTQHWDNMPVETAIATVRRLLDAEKAAYIALRIDINDDQWFASYWSEVLAWTTPPSEDDWSAPLIPLGRASNRNHLRDYSGSVEELKEAIRAFNAVHKKFLIYRDGLAQGAERSITALKITIMLTGAAFSAGIGVAGASIMGGAVASGGLTLVEEASGQAMKRRYDLQKKYDVLDLVIQTGASFVSSLLSGVLCEKFATYIARRYFGSALARWAVVEMYNMPGLPQMAFDDIASWATRSGVALPLGLKLTSAEAFLSGFFASFDADRLLSLITSLATRKKGETLQLDPFLQFIADNVPMPPLPPMPHKENPVRQGPLRNPPANRPKASGAQIS
jgi:hypothetical protein